MSRHQRPVWFVLTLYDLSHTSFRHLSPTQTATQAFRLSLQFSNQACRMLRFPEAINKRFRFRSLSVREKEGYSLIEDEERKNPRKSKFRVFFARIPPILSHWVRKNGHATIISLGDDLLTKIYEYLPLVDKACLSLTCKRLFGLFGTVTKNTQFVFPRLLYIRVPILCVNSEDVPRNQLLLRLENRRWAYCADCLKLHPRKEFTRSSLGSPAPERRCSPFAGIVDICPCNSLTLRQRDHIIELLESPTTQPGMEYRTFRFERNEQPKMVHDCSFRFKFGCRVHCSIHLSVKPSDGLAMSTRYTICFSPAKSRLTVDPIFACPHQDLMSLIRQKRMSEFCPRCWTVILRSPRRANYPGQEIFGVRRVLGDARCPTDGVGVLGRQSVWRESYRLTGTRYLTDSEPWYSPASIYPWIRTSTDIILGRSPRA